MVIRGYERETGSLFVTLTGLGNFIGRVIGAFVRFYVKYVCNFILEYTETVNDLSAVELEFSKLNLPSKQ